MNDRALTRALVVPSIALLLTIGASTAVTSQDGGRNSWQNRWVFLFGFDFNLDGEVTRVKNIITRAANAGYNGVVLSWFQIAHWWQDQDPGQRQHGSLLAVREHAANLGMHFRLQASAIGYCEALLLHDPNLISGYPIVNMPLHRVGNELVPLATTDIVNGSFEVHVNDDFDGWNAWPSGGARISADPVDVVSGGYSVRFDFETPAGEGGASMNQIFDVVPFQQYRLKVWFKTEDLTADWATMGVYGVDDGNRVDWRRQVSSRYLSYPWDGYGSDGTGRTGGSHFAFAIDKLTLDWTEVTVSFNSMELTEVALAPSVGGARGGRIWWDDWRIDSSPTLNVIRRDSLPLTIASADGSPYSEGVDFDPISDPRLGRALAPFWQGLYDTHYAPPAIIVPAGSGIGSGETVYFSGYHALLATSGQVSCSLSDTGVYGVMEEIVRRSEDAFDPDGYLLSYSEIRTGGWEPDQIANYGTTGEVLAAHITEMVKRVDALTGNKPLHVWSDMFDPYHNAFEHHYHVNNTLEGSWLGVPTSVGIVNWSGIRHDGFKLERARKSLEFFEGRNHEQIIAGYYDQKGDVVENHRGWTTAADDLHNVTSVMYTTWEDDYTELELFAKTWWGGRGHQLAGPGRLDTGDFIQAEGAACRLVFQSDGDLVAYADDEAYWSAGTKSTARGGWAEMQVDGNFVVYSTSGVALWSTGTGGNPGARIVIEDDCNVVVRARGGAQLWASGRPSSLSGLFGGSAVRAVHLTELRTRIDAARRQCGLANVSWTDPVIVSGVTPIQAVHITQARTAIDAAYRACERMPPSWTDPEIISGVTSVKALHFAELRDAVQGWNGPPGRQGPGTVDTILRPRR